MDRNIEFEKLVDDLLKSKTEDQIIRSLTKMIKEFNISLYKEIILSNPYYKSLIIDIKDEVKREISIIRNSIVEEISEIENEISNPNNKFIDKLKSLKRDCISLLYEIDERERDINQLI